MTHDAELAIVPEKPASWLHDFVTSSSAVLSCVALPHPSASAHMSLTAVTLQGGGFLTSSSVLSCVEPHSAASPPAAPPAAGCCRPAPSGPPLQPLPGGRASEAGPSRQVTRSRTASTTRAPWLSLGCCLVSATLCTGNVLLISLG